MKKFARFSNVLLGLILFFVAVSQAEAQNQKCPNDILLFNSKCDGPDGGMHDCSIYRLKGDDFNPGYKGYKIYSSEATGSLLNVNIKWNNPLNEKKTCVFTKTAPSGWSFTSAYIINGGKKLRVTSQKINPNSYVMPLP